MPASRRMASPSSEEKKDQAVEWPRPATASVAKPTGWRSPLDPVILSTVPHFVALLFIAGCPDSASLPGLYLGYTIVVGISSFLSLAWHFQREPKNWSFWLDYAFAGIWTVYDFVIFILKAPVPHILTMVFLNALVFITNQMGDWLARTKTGPGEHDVVFPYEKGHALWHLLSCLKSIFVAYLVGCRYRDDCRA